MRNATLVEGGVPLSKRKVESSEKLSGDSQNGTESGLRPAADREVGAPRLSTNDSQLSTPLAALPPGEWKEFMASRPDLAAKFAALVAQFHAEVPVFKTEVAQWTQRTIHLAEHGRQIGIAVVELEEMFAGKRLTVDFWQQIEPLFVDAATGQKISKEMLMWFGKVARAHLEPITEVHAARAMMQPLLLASGDAEFQLIAERAPQHAHAPAVPLNSFVDYFDISRMEKLWNDLKADGTSFVDGKLNPDLVPVLRVDFERPIRLVEEIKKELGF